MMQALRRVADHRQGDTLATRLRRERFGLFRSLVASVPRPLSILDVGGTEPFWEAMGFTGGDDVRITLLNLSKVDVDYPNFTSIAGDARDMGEFGNNQFDVVFSNSVIEHVGTREEQARMAREIMRVGQRYFVQTPNRFFPIEPHFLFPFFQFLPLPLRVFLVRHFDMGWYTKAANRREAVELARSVRLLTERELRRMFPRARIYKEKFLGLNKSFIAYEGWTHTERVDSPAHSPTATGKEQASAKRQ